MRRFRFRFAAVERVRKLREEEALRALAGAQRAYQMELAAKRELLEAREKALLRRERIASIPAEINAYQIETAFIDGAKIRAAQADQRILRAYKLLGKVMAAFVAARRRTRSIEILREKEHAEFRRAERIRESKELDELVGARHGRDFLAGDEGTRGTGTGGTR